jgi:threonine dehydrogenase-like Zn-dependent dehydrogenase
MKGLQFNVNIPKFITAKILKTFFGKGIFFSGPFKTIRLADIKEPEIFHEDWVKLKTLGCGFCASDLNLICLHDSPTASPFTSFPCIIGHEILGEIVEKGANVKNFKLGDRIAVNPGLSCETRGIDPKCDSCNSGRMCNCENFAQGNIPPGMFIGINNKIGGGFAPYLIAHKSQLYLVPKSMSFESAIMVEPVAVALQAVFDNLPQKEEKILVIGSGVIGNLIIQSIRTLIPGCNISVIDPSSFASDLALSVGADEIIPINEVFSGTEKITKAKTYKPQIGMEIQMGGFNRIYDTIGNSSTLNLSMRILKASGNISVVGIGGDVKLDLTPLWLKHQKLIGVFAYGLVKYNRKKHHIFDIAIELLKDKHINADILVTHKFALEDYKKMLKVNMNKGKYNAMKSIVSFI